MNTIIIRLPTSTKEIKVDDLHKLLRNKFEEANIFLSDMTYKLCNPEDIKYFLSIDGTNRFEYEAESYDCDNFSYRLMGQFSIPEWATLCFGICWTDKHALNFFIDEERKFWFVEPQNDSVQENLSSWQGNKVLLIMI